MHYHLTEGKGSRRYMEDTHITPNGDGLFAVFDGHGGSQASQYCRDNAKSLFYALLDQHKNNVFTAFNALFWKLQAQLVQVAKNSGTTATFIYVDGEDLYTANVGDSEAVILQENAVIKLTTSHRAGLDPTETSLVEAAGGVVIGGRVDRCLSVTRALGDFSLYPRVQPAPTVSQVRLKPEDRYIIFATDGLWDGIKMIELPKLLAETQNDITLMVDILAKHSKASHDNYTVGVIGLNADITGSSYTFTREMHRDQMKQKAISTIDRSYQ